MVKQQFEDLHCKYVITLIDKTTGNVTFTYQQFYAYLLVKQHNENNNNNLIMITVEALRTRLSVKKAKKTPEYEDCVCDLLQILNCKYDLFNYRAVKLVTYTVCMCLNMYTVCI